MTLSDLVSVTLTKTGADIINYRHQCVNKRFPKANLKVDYNTGDEWHTQLWGVIEVFGPELNITVDLPFSSLEPR